jgi:ubiquinone/menaquinone biosynthesis C-methylase UbiE
MEADWIDFLPERSEARRARKRGFGPALMQNPLLALIYERVWRPGFVIVSTRRIPDLGAELRWIEQSLHPVRDGVILDLSCGPGVVGRRLADDRAGGSRFGRVVGLDLSEPMLRRCAAACRREGIEDFPLTRADVSALPFARGSLAGVHAGAGLHVWPNPERAIAEVARVLRPGGRFVASTFLRHPSMRPHGVGPIVGRALELSSRVRMFEREELRGMCEAEGLIHFEARELGALILFSVTREQGETGP